MEHPQISVLIPSYNSAHYLSVALNSVERQTFTDWECLIVDDGSTDGTRQIAESHVQRDPRFRYFYKDNGGLPSTRNYGLERARGRWVQFLDADDWLAEDKFSRQLAAAEKLTATVPRLVYSDYEVVTMDDHDGESSRRDVIIGAKSREQLLSDMINWAFHPDVSLHANNVLIERSAFDSVRFDESFRTFGDMELFVRMLCHPVECVYVPMRSMGYRVHQHNITRNMALTRTYYLQYLAAIERHHPGLLKQYARPDGLVANVRKLVLECIAQRNHDRLRQLESLIDEIGLPIRVRGGRWLGRNRIIEMLYLLRPVLPRRVWMKIWQTTYEKPHFQ